MTDRLREVFEDMLAGEPPLRTSADNAEAAGRQLRQRHRTLWTVAGAAVAAALVVGVPTVLTPVSNGERSWSAATAASASPEASPSHRPPTPTPTPLPTPSPGLSVPTPLIRPQLVGYRHCPANPAAYVEDNHDGSVLPDPARAAAAVVKAGADIAAGEKFLINTSRRFTSMEKLGGVPQVTLIFDIGGEHGYGSLNLQLLPDRSGTPAERAERDLDLWNSCVDVQRRDYTDGSVAIYYPYGPPAQEAETTHVWYYAVAGYTMNIGEFPSAAPLPARGSLPLTIDQVMDVADVVAHS